jgi:hypothetical protein
MTDKCQPEHRFDLQLAALKEYINLKIAALQAEYSKSELNYPTRQQLNQELGRMLTKDEASLKFDDLGRQIKIIIGFLVGLFMLFVADYLRR